MKAKVVIAHPFEIWSAGIATILTQAGYQVLGQWANTADALGAARSAEANVLIMARDWLTPSTLNGAEGSLRRDYSGKIVLVLDPGSELSAQEFVALDVEGLILSSASASDFAECMDVVRMGRRWLDPEVRGLLGFTERKALDCQELSAREAEVASLAASGLTNKKIAKMLAVSDGTIKMHMHHILTKLHLISRQELSMFWKAPSQMGKRGMPEHYNS